VIGVDTVVFQQYPVHARGNTGDCDLYLRCGRGQIVVVIVPQHHGSFAPVSGCKRIYIRCPSHAGLQNLVQRNLARLSLSRRGLRDGWNAYSESIGIICQMKIGLAPIQKMARREHLLETG
jgi:hypothetical protein